MCYTHAHLFHPCTRSVHTFRAILARSTQSSASLCCHVQCGTLSAIIYSCCCSNVPPHKDWVYLTCRKFEDHPGESYCCTGVILMFYCIINDYREAAVIFAKSLRRCFQKPESPVFKKNVSDSMLANSWQNKMPSFCSPFAEQNRYSLSTHNLNYYRKTRHKEEIHIIKPEIPTFMISLIFQFKSSLEQKIENSLDFDGLSQATRLDYE